MLQKQSTSTHRQTAGTSDSLKDKFQELDTAKLAADIITKTNDRPNETSCQPTGLTLYSHVHFKQCMKGKPAILWCKCVWHTNDMYTSWKTVLDRWTHRNILETKEELWGGLTPTSSVNHASTNSRKCLPAGMELHSCSCNKHSSHRRCCCHVLFTRRLNTPALVPKPHANMIL